MLGLHLTQAAGYQGLSENGRKALTYILHESNKGRMGEKAYENMTTDKNFRNTLYWLKGEILYSVPQASGKTNKIHFYQK